MNLQIQDGILTIPAKMIGTRILKDEKKIDKIENLRKNAKEDLFDGYGNKIFMIAKLEEIQSLQDEYRFYDIQKPEHLEDDEFVLIINNLKSSASDAQIAKAIEFHQTAIEKLTMMIS